MTTEFKIGLFVLSGLAIVVAGLIGFGLRRRLEPRAEFETYVPGSVSGLTVGSAVKLRGVHVGEVTRLGFSWLEYPGERPPSVVVHFTVRQNVLLGPPTPETISQELGPNLRAVVEPQGITGVAVLSLETVDPAEFPAMEYTWKPRHVVISSAPSRFDQILDSVQSTLVSLQRLDVDRLSSRLERVLDSADLTLRRFGELDAKLVGRDAHRLLVGLGESNEAVKRLVERFSSIDVRDLNETLAGTRRAARHLDDVMERLKEYPPGFFFGKEPPPITRVEKDK